MLPLILILLMLLPTLLLMMSPVLWLPLLVVMARGMDVAGIGVRGDLWEVVDGEVESVAGIVKG